MNVADGSSTPNESAILATRVSPCLLRDLSALDIATIHAPVGDRVVDDRHPEPVRHQRRITRRRQVRRRTSSTAPAAAVVDVGYNVTVVPFNTVERQRRRARRRQVAVPVGCLALASCGSV
jgi:hypothetical protein